MPACCRSAIRTPRCTIGLPRCSIISIEPQVAAVEMVRFEMQMLAELGFGLDLATCAATGAEDDLGYVSPKSGRAVSRLAAAPWQDRLFRLPGFLSEPVAASLDDIADGFALTGFFLGRHVLEPRGIAFADAREGFVAAVAGTAAGRAGGAVGVQPAMDDCATQKRRVVPSMTRR